MTDKKGGDAKSSLDGQIDNLEEFFSKRRQKVRDLKNLVESGNYITDPLKVASKLKERLDTQIQEGNNSLLKARGRDPKKRDPKKVVGNGD